MDQELDKALEGAEWRVTQREQSSGYNQAASMETWGTILRFVMDWQNTWEGRSPSMYQIAKETGLTGSTVRYHCGQMMLKGLIRFKPVTGIEITGAGKAITGPPAEAQGPTEKTEEAKVNTTKGQRLYGGALVNRAKAVAGFINDYRSRYGVSPPLKEVASGVGIKSASAISRTVGQMVLLGWVDHSPNRQGDIVITSLGRQTLFGDSAKAETNTFNQEDAQAAADWIERQEAINEVAMVALSPKPIGTVMAEAMSPEPDPAATPDVSRMDDQTGPPDLATVRDADLILELLDRGFMVTRQKR